jgi:hypothetical protein
MDFIPVSNELKIGKYAAENGVNRAARNFSIIMFVVFMDTIDGFTIMDYYHYGTWMF